MPDATKVHGGRDTGATREGSRVVTAPGASPGAAPGTASGGKGGGGCCAAGGCSPAGVPLHFAERGAQGFTPRIVAYFCHWCSYGAADLAGVNRLDLPADFRIVRVPCSGRVGAELVLHAFRQGADGVWISGCHPGDCHYTDGNLHARRRLDLLASYLTYAGLEPQRLLLSWISSAEASRFCDLATEFCTTIRDVGPCDFLKVSLDGEPGAAVWNGAALLHGDIACGSGGATTVVADVAQGERKVRSEDAGGGA